MKIKTVSETGKITISIKGRIDSSNYFELENETDQIDFKDAEVIFDFKRVPYITSAGLRVLLMCDKKAAPGKIHIKHVNDAVYDVLETNGFLSLFDVKKAEGLPKEMLQWSFKKALAKRVEKDNETPKLFFGDTGYSWKDVDIYSQIMADDLAKMGVKKGSHVGLASVNGIEWVSAFFAIQKLGAIAIFINFNLKSEEIISLASIGDIAYLCYGVLPGIQDRDKFVSDILKESSAIKKVYDISPDSGILDRKEEYKNVAQLYSEMFDPDDSGIMIFTSGSTSKPKGVLSSSYNHLVQTDVVNKIMKVTSEDRICCFLPLFHIFGFGCGLAPALLLGAAIYFPVDSKVPTILNTIEKYKCTVFHSVPTMMLSIINHPDFTSEKVESVELSYLGGAPVSDAQLLKIKEKFTNDNIGVFYGMSEVAPITMTVPEDSVEHIVSTVGKPLPVLDFEIRDTQTGQVCKNGERGEIFVRAKTVLTCYYKLPADSQAMNSDGWLSTGDLGIMDEDGYVRLVGRIKDLIIRAGENIAPAEIERAISELDEIADVKVVGVPHPILGEEVAAAVVLKPGAVLDEEAVKNYLMGRLAKYKVPQYFVVYDKFMTLGSGKIDVMSLKDDVAKKIG